MSAFPSVSPYPLYPQGSAALQARRSAPMGAAANPQLNINAENQALKEERDYTGAAETDVYGRLNSQQKQDFVPYQTGVPTGHALGRLHGIGPTGQVTDQVNDNTEGIARGNFNTAFQAALKAGKGDEFAAKYGAGEGYQARYDAAQQKASQATDARVRMLPQQQDQDQTFVDPHIQIAQINANARLVAAALAAGSRDKATDATAKWKQDTLDETKRYHDIIQNVDLTTEAGRKQFRDETALFHRNMEAIAQRNADTAAKNADTNANKLLQPPKPAKQMTPQDWARFVTSPGFLNLSKEERTKIKEQAFDALFGGDGTTPPAAPATAPAAPATAPAAPATAPAAPATAPAPQAGVWQTPPNAPQTATPPATAPSAPPVATSTAPAPASQPAPAPASQPARPAQATPLAAAGGQLMLHPDGRILHPSGAEYVQGTDQNGRPGFIRKDLAQPQFGAPPAGNFPIDIQAANAAAQRAASR